MTTPNTNENEKPKNHDTTIHTPLPHRTSHEKSDEEGTVIGDHNGSPMAEVRRAPTHDSQRANTYDHHTNPNLLHINSYDGTSGLSRIESRSRTREREHRLDDDLVMLKVEQQVSEAQIAKDTASELRRTASRRNEDIDEFDIATNPVHEKAQIYNPPSQPVTNVARFVKRLHSSSFLIRWLTYITPVVIILLIPLLLAAFVFKEAAVGGVSLFWFMIWLQICWLTLWAGRLLAKALPWPIGLISSMFTNNSKKWRDMGKQLELPATLFFWWLGVEISFLPTMIHHQTVNGVGTTDVQGWQTTANRVFVSILVGVILNFVEKIIIQLIAISFHLRTYQDRIELNKFQIGSLTKLYEYSRKKITMEDSEFEQRDGPGSGARTPGAFFNEATKQTKDAVNKFGDVAGKIAGDFTGKNVIKSSHPYQVTLTLLNSVGGSQILARRLYRTYAREDTQTVFEEDLLPAYSNEEESAAAFSMFDKDMNGDISMEELEAVCVEIGRERKSITASLKDLDSVVAKLDDVFMFVVVIITILVFISLISSSAATAITSAGSTLLALSWLFSTTAQEFLQSVIFVFVKHPFDVGDRVSIYGNTGSLGRGDDYFVKEISLLYTEFKKMEGHIVQAPNSYLNTLFILNQRRSGGLAEAVPVTFKYGTTLDQMEQLRTRLLEFVKAEKREYQGNILTELREVTEAHSITMNVVFFYKSNWQNEGLRLARRNKFICALMVTMQELNIEGPRMRYPGMKESFPLYMQNIPHFATAGMGRGGHPDNNNGYQPETTTTTEEGLSRDPPFVPPPADYNLDGSNEGGDGLGVMSPDFRRVTSFRAPTRRQRTESLSAMNRRVDFSLGASSSALNSDLSGDVYEDRSRSRAPPAVIKEVSESRERERTASNAIRASMESQARSTSIAPNHNNIGPGNLARRSTESARTNHRNRFFGQRRGTTSTMPSDREDMYALESGLADVPEGDSGRNTVVPPSATASVHGAPINRPSALHFPHHETPTSAMLGGGFTNSPLTSSAPFGSKLDPRTGQESAAAWHPDHRGISPGGHLQPIDRRGTDGGSVEMRKLS